MISATTLLTGVLPEQASNWAKPVDDVFWIVTWVCFISFILVEGLLFYFIFKYRRKKGEPDKKTPFITHDTTLEIIWTVVPTIVVMVIFYYGLVTYLDMRNVPKDALEVKITGKQWSWDFSYEHKGKTISGNTNSFCDDTKLVTKVDCENAGKKWNQGDAIKLPYNKKIKFWMTSTDVLHSFYIPAFRVKQDVVPGMYSYLWFQPTKKTQPGQTFDVFCTEYCGKDHSGMLAQIEVVDEPVFLAWLDGKAPKETGDGPIVGNVAEGSTLFKKKACIACHNLAGQRLVGPPLNGLMGRKEKLTTGKTITINEEYIRESIMDPAAKVVATYPPMAAQNLTKVEVEHLIAYLKSLK